MMPERFDRLVDRLCWLPTYQRLGMPSASPLYHHPSLLAVWIRVDHLVDHDGVLLRLDKAVR